MIHNISVSVNGIRHDRRVESRLLLVHLLRDGLGLTGTHVGCETSICGACTLLVDGLAVKSCTMLAVQANGKSITTIEGLAPGDGLHPLQDAFRVKHGLQCGFCTPGMIMAAYQLLARHASPSVEQIRHGLDGNFCRCTGYAGIIEAVFNTRRPPSTAGSRSPYPRNTGHERPILRSTRHSP